MRAIAILNQKGGCGKTTTAINLAAAFARRGRRTLLVDMDPQSHCAAGLAVPEGRVEAGIGEALIAKHDRSFEPEDHIWEVSGQFHLFPSTMRLAALEAPGGPLHELPDRDRRLEGLLGLLSPRYDYCLIDCPPSIGLLSFNALRAAREAIIPVETGFFSLRGAQKQWKTIQRLINHVNHPVVCHLLPTLHDEQSQNARKVLAALRREFGSQLLPVVIREHEELREAASAGQPVLDYAPGSDAEYDFEALTDWLEERGTVAPTIEVFARMGHDNAEVPRHEGMDDDDGSVSCLDDSALSCAETSIPSGRAAELALRMRQMGQVKSADHRRPEMPPPPLSEKEGSGAFGVFPFEGGVRFVQPGSSPRSIFIAGDFNDWSPSATPMRYNFESGVYEAFVTLPPGRYAYRLVVDGQWQEDPYNRGESNEEESSSTFEVRQLQEAQ